MKGFITLDIETTIQTYFRRKASVFSPDNWIVATGWAVDMADEEDIQHEYYGHKQRGSEGWFARLLEEHDPRYIVGFNIKFDILHLIRHEVDYQAWMAWIARGGQLWDTQLVEYLLEGQRQEAHMLSLDEVAPRYGGNLKIDEVKAMWEQGINTPDIPRQLLIDYLVGRRDAEGAWEHGDIGNTRLAFIGQREAAIAAKQVRSIQLNNGALVATIEMERNGLYVDMERGREQAEKLRLQSIGLIESLKTSLPKDLPFEFKWTSRKQLSALIFGGSIPYPVRVHLTDDESGEPLYAMKDEVQYVLTNGETTPWAPIPRMQQTDEQAMHTPHLDRYVHYATGKQKGLPKTKNVKVPDHTRPKLKWVDHYYKFPRMAQPKKEWETAEKGVYSTKAEIIEELGGQGIEFLDNFADLKDIQKDLGTYYITEELDDDGNVVKSSGMLLLVHPDGLVHSNISMVSTVTGRFAHSIPNVGNLPKADTSDVKMLFISRWGEDGYMMSSDFTSLEVYASAINSGDKQLISDLLAGLDMHIKRLSQAESKDYDWLTQKIKVEKVKEWVTKRKHIKVFSFQRQYGAGPPKIARFLKLPVDLIKSWADLDDEMYPGVKAFNEKVERVVKQSRVPTAKFMQHPVGHMPVQLGVGYFRTFDGKKYVFNEYPSLDFQYKRGQLTGFKPTELKNYKDQGLGGEFMKAAMWLAVRAFYHYKNFGGKALLVNTVHDALYTDSHASVARKAAVLIDASMRAASDFMEFWFEHTIPTPVPSETTYGPSMFIEHSFTDEKDSEGNKLPLYTPGFAEHSAATRVWLRDQYMDGYTPSYFKD